MNMSTETILITRTAYASLLDVCRGLLPNEACGLLAGDRSGNARTITTVIPLTNRHSEPRTGFAFDPAEWVQAYYGIQKNRQWFAGLYHSHPSSDAVPSVRDERGYGGPEGSMYWIVSFAVPQNAVVQPYYRSKGRFVPFPLVIA